jgi:hypothetical protein
MATTELQEVVNIVASEYRARPYSDLESLVDKKTICFEKEHEGKSD